MSGNRVLYQRSRLFSQKFFKTEIQQCIIHQIRNSTKYVSYTDIKALMADLKRVYGAIDEETALYELEQFSAKWDAKYPTISQSWQAHWPELSTYFKYPQSVRTLIYTTNAIENFNRQLRKVTKSKSVFPNDDALLKMLYLTQVNITKKWIGRRRDWGEIHSQLEVFFADNFVFMPLICVYTKFEEEPLITPVLRSLFNFNYFLFSFIFY